MDRYSFLNDYSEGAHPDILDLITKTNLNQEEGYGKDTLSQQAVKLIQQNTENPEATVHFVSGGTQANLLALAAMLKPYESVIAAGTAHICVHEAGAIEATGHKINVINSTDGKLRTDDILCILHEHSDEHMVKPKAVFISNSTEVGTIYKKCELEAISQVCRQNNLYLYLDGARLGSALANSESDLSLADISKWVDVFYIGGTKNGALLGEALVINKKELQQDFRYHLKQRGALLSKGRILGVQFAGLFQNNLFYELALHANAMAGILTQGIKDQGYTFLTHSPTNQIFPIFPNELIQRLQKKYDFYVWAKTDEDHSVVRLVTSWATKEKMVTEFIQAIGLYHQRS